MHSGQKVRSYSALPITVHCPLNDKQYSRCTCMETTLGEEYQQNIQLKLLAIKGNSMICC